MSRYFGAVPLLAVLSLAVTATGAEDKATVKELRDLRTLVETQSKQIDELTRQVTKLIQTVESNSATTAPVAPAVQTTVPTIPTPPVNEFSADVPKAEAADGKRHVVIKGETLTSIAKSYNIALSELQKANKGVDERKLQIGATLIIPTTKAPEATPAPPATPTDKKENP